MKGAPAKSRQQAGSTGRDAPERPEKRLLEGILGGEALVLRDAQDAVPAGQGAILADRLLQDISDYRGTLRRWFAGLRVGGHLALVVPHAFLAERQLAQPVESRPMQKRLYTPASLLEEVEEALVPNEYRVRLMHDDDRDYDYGGDRDAPPTGSSAIVLLLEKIAPPAWSLAGPQPGGEAPPDYSFASPRTRIEVAATRPRRRILILKLDHLGDFVMGIPALEHARAIFRDAHITLIVGSWNLDMARTLELADEVLAFDAFPRNSSEEEVDVAGKRALFDALLPEYYDLAIDLRTDTDTRTLLGRTRAAIKAGIGRKTDFPFLDIPLAIELDRVEREAAREYRLDGHAFSSQETVRRLDHRLVFPADRVDRGGAILWGPYSRLRAGRYLFDPFLEIEGDQGLLMLDVAVQGQQRARTVVAPGDALRLEFDVERDDDAFEFRIWAVEEAPPPAFSFYGGKLIREGAPGLLHQSDYLALLLELVARRLDRVGMLTEAAQP